jgi:hypothetical protein
MPLDGGFSMPIFLDRSQFLQIANAAAALFPSDRDGFINAVAAELEGRWPIGDGTIDRAIRAVQGRFHHPEPEAPPRWGREVSRLGRMARRNA